MQITCLLGCGFKLFLHGSAQEIINKTITKMIVLKLLGEAGGTFMVFHYLEYMTGISFSFVLFCISFCHCFLFFTVHLPRSMIHHTVLVCTSQNQNIPLKRSVVQNYTATSPLSYHQSTSLALIIAVKKCNCLQCVILSEYICNMGLPTWLT